MHSVSYCNLSSFTSRNPQSLLVSAVQIHALRLRPGLVVKKGQQVIDLLFVVLVARYKGWLYSMASAQWLALIGQQWPEQSLCRSVPSVVIQSSSLLQSADN